VISSDCRIIFVLFQLSTLPL